MIKKILNTILTGNKFLCIEIVLGEANKKYNAIEILKKKNSLTINTHFSSENLDTLIKQIPKNLPTLLSFSGQGIITKKVENIPNFQSKILFNANPDDFYWYQLEQQTYMYCSVVRKTIIDDEMDKFEAHKLSIVDVSLGPYVLSTINPLITNQSSLFTEDFELKFNDGMLIDISKKNVVIDYDYYHVGDEKIAVKDIIPFSNLLNYLYPNENIETDKQFLNQKREEFLYKKAFNMFGAVVLVFFLSTLLISYLLLSYYQNDYLKLQVELETQNIAYDKLLTLENDKKNKEAILFESGLNNSNFLSFYISEITKEIPAEINLTELNIFPTQNKIKQNQRINFINDLVRLEGLSNSNSSFADWIKTLKKITWIKNVEIIDYKNEGRTNTFKIKLTLQFNV